VAVSFIQAASGSTTVSSTVTVTLSTPTTAGNCLIACVANGNGAPLAFVSSATLGGAADNWAALKTSGDVNNGAEVLSVWADPNCAGGQTSVVINCTGGGATTLAWVFEFSGVLISSVLDQFATFDSVAGSNATFSVTTGVTAQASEVAVGCVYGFNQTITGPGAPWVNESLLAFSGRNLLASYNILSSTGTVTYSGSFGGATFNGQILVTLRGAVPASPGPPQSAPDWRKASWLKRELIW
jgi:hypothetical protein